MFVMLLLILLEIKYEKILLVGGCGFIGHNLALHLKRGADPIIVDSLGQSINFTDNEIANKKLYSLILQNRLDLINSNNIKLIVQDARDYHTTSKIYDEIKLISSSILLQFRMQINQIKIPIVLLITVFELWKIH